MSNRLYVKYPLFLSNFNKILIFSTDFRKNSNIGFNQYPSSSSQVFPCGQTDMKKLRVVFNNYTNAPKKVPTKYKLNINGSQTCLAVMTRGRIIIFMTLRRTAQCNYLMKIVSIVWHPKKDVRGRQKSDPTG